MEKRVAATNLSGDGLATFVDRLPRIVPKMLGETARWPRHLFTDRGTGMYNPQGKVVKVCGDAVKRNGFHLYWGPDASTQSPDMGDMLLHETAASWFRNALRKIKPDVLAMGSPSSKGSGAGECGV